MHFFAFTEYWHANAIRRFGCTNQDPQLRITVPDPVFLKRRMRSIVRPIFRNSVRLPILVVTAGFVFGIGLNFSETRQRVTTAEFRMHAVETFALSSVGRLVPGRESVRKAQAIAIMDAQGMGIDLSIASVGVGAKRGGDSAADEIAFARLARRFPETLKAAEEGDAFRERLSKAWKSDSKALADGSPPNGKSQIISDAQGRIGACVVEMRASGESLNAMISMAYLESEVDANKRKARSLGISATDVAFLVSAHESAHCVIGMARRAGLFSTAWADPKWKIPLSWSDARFEDDRDSPALAKAEESAADALAILWAADVLGARKARQLGHFAIYARSRGARSSSNDGLHDSSRVLTRILAMGKNDQPPSTTNRAMLAWQTASFQTKDEIFERAALQMAAEQRPSIF